MVWPGVAVGCRLSALCSRCHRPYRHLPETSTNFLSQRVRKRTSIARAPVAPHVHTHIQGGFRVPRMTVSCQDGADAITSQNNRLDALTSSRWSAAEALRWNHMAPSWGNSII